jgi:hypothetical protein
MRASIKTCHQGADRVKEARVQTLITEYDGLKTKDQETIDDFASKLSGLASKSASLGRIIEDARMVKKFLTSFPRRFIHTVASIEQVLDLNSISFEDVVDRLKAFEERI